MEPLNRAQLGLLSRFIHAEAFDGGGYARVWQQLLGESVEAVTARFQSLGLIERSSAEVQLTCSYGAAQLKEKAKLAGVGATGTKLSIAARLAAALTADEIPTLFGTCTALGRDLAQSYLDQQRQHREAAEAAVKSALDASDLRGAAEVGAAWDMSQLFPSGLGMESFTLAARTKLVLGRLEHAQHALSNPPSALASLDQPNLAWLVSRFQRSAAMNDDATRNAEVRGRTWSDDLSPSMAMPLLNAWVANRSQLFSFRDSGVVRAVKILPPGDCALAEKLAGRSYSIDECPELPLAGCERNYGCACCYTTVI